MIHPTDGREIYESPVSSVFTRVLLWCCFPFLVEARVSLLRNGDCEPDPGKPRAGRSDTIVVMIGNDYLYAETGFGSTPSSL